MDMYLIPRPKRMSLGEGKYVLRYEDVIAVGSGLDERAVAYAGILRDDVERYGGYVLGITRGRFSGGVSLKVDTEGDMGLKEQEYVLEVNEKGAFVTGGGYGGLLYGVQTLRQIIRQEGVCLPFVRIEDGPDILNRGFYHDVSRCRIPTLAFLKELADKLAYYKINQMQLYIEHSFLFSHMSEIWRDDTPLTAEDILELDRYCRGLAIELVPSLSSFGHMYKILSSKSFGHLCELPEAEKQFSFMGRMRHHTVDVSNGDSLKLVKGMIEEFLPLFSSRQFNICADETFDLGKGRSKGLADRLGLGRIYMNYVKELCGFLEDKGLRAMFWGDIICDFPEAVKELPEGTVCLNWCYEAEPREEPVRKLYEAGAVQYLCPGVAGWNKLSNLLEQSYRNIGSMCTYARRYHAEGLLNTDWGDFGHVNHPWFSLPGMIYGAAFSWNGEVPGYEELNRQISRLEFGDASEELVSLVADISTWEVFGWEQAVLYMEKCEAGCPEEEKEAYFRQCGIERTEAANKALDRIEEGLYGSIAGLSLDRRAAVKPYIQAVQAARIFNLAGMALGCSRYGMTAWDPIEARELAERLETWFYHYKQLWRSVSRESELYRLQHVIEWYGDMLRDMR